MPRPNKSGLERTRLKAWLRDERRKQEWLAEQVDVHQTTISLWMRGGDIPLEKALRIAAITGLTIEDISVIDPVPAPSSSDVTAAGDDDDATAPRNGTEG